MTKRKLPYSASIPRFILICGIRFRNPLFILICGIRFRNPRFILICGIRFRNPRFILICGIRIRNPRFILICGIRLRNPRFILICGIRLRNPHFGSAFYPNPPVSCIIVVLSIHLLRCISVSKPCVRGGASEGLCVVYYSCLLFNLNEVGKVQLYISTKVSATFPAAHGLHRFIIDLFII